MAEPEVNPHPDPHALPLIIDTAPVPPSVPGVPQPVFAGGSATTPAPPIDITGSPIAPPPVFGQGGGAPPQFPPAPPVGPDFDPVIPVPIPPGVLVGPAIAPAAVPPSVAGIALIRTVSAWTAAFPDFQTVYPKPPIVFTNTMMIGNTKPPQTATTENIHMGGLGPPPAPPVITPHAARDESLNPYTPEMPGHRVVPDTGSAPEEEPREPPSERRRRRK